MTRLGLALGGGGVVGVAWEVGVVAGLAEASGWDPAGVHALVGTSAGSIVGTQLLQGRAVDELVAGQRGPAAGEVPVRPELDLAALGEIFGAWTTADEVTPELARRIGARAATAATVPEDDYVASFGPMLDAGSWPAGDLRVTGVSVETGERAVWTSTSDVPLARAVAASCAVPGMFPPVRVGGGTFVDGGVWSGSNADALLGSGAEAVVFIGPLVGETGLGRVSGLALERERKLLADEGIPLLDVVPGERFAAFGQDLMNPAHRAAALDVGRADGEAAAARLRGVLAQPFGQPDPRNPLIRVPKPRWVSR
jgi:NTE family protein